jgi:hypothetical protein
VAEQPGPLEICCDAPSYWIVRACRDLGIRTPEDVRWLRLSAFKRRAPAPAPGGVAGFVAGLFGRAGAPPGAGCTCGARLPEPSASLIVVDAGEALGFRIGQCPRCRTVFWDAV